MNVQRSGVRSRAKQLSRYTILLHVAAEQKNLPSVTTTVKTNATDTGLCGGRVTIRLHQSQICQSLVVVHRCRLVTASTSTAKSPVAFYTYTRGQPSDPGLAENSCTSNHSAPHRPIDKTRAVFWGDIRPCAHGNAVDDGHPW